MPDSAKMKLRQEEFTACNFYSLIKTRLSHGSYKACGAIVIGTTNEKACDALHFEHMAELIKKNKANKE